jgi:ABC-2 type transport system permease protein
MMSMRRAYAIAKNDFELLIQDPVSVIILVVMPLIVMAFTKPTYAAVLKQHGYPTANGAEQAVPGMALLFIFFMVTFAGLAFFRDHIWNTWDRIRALPVRHSEIMLGKVIPSFVFICLQELIVFVIGHVFFGLHIRGSVSALVAVDLAFAVWLVTFILVTVAYCKTFQQVLAVSNLGAILFAGVGGVLTPLASLPGWAKAISPATPDYWAMTGFNSVLLNGKGLGAVTGPVAVLLGSAVVLTALAAVRFRFDAPKGGVLPGV